jgi:hypothetical protein
MRTSAAKALFALSVDAFIDGLADEAQPPEAFGLTPEQGGEIRRKIYAERIREKRAKKAKVA